jgi:phosphonate transport system substrate-binding protein
MSDAQPPAPPAPATPPARRGVSAFTLGLIALLLAAAGAFYAYTVYSQPDPTPPDELTALKSYLAHLGRTQKLKDGYADANGDLVADPPTDKEKFLTVGEIGFTAVATDDPDDLARTQERWKGLMAALEQATGKKVKYLAEVASPEEQARAVAEGRLHVTAFNTGQVATAVNTAGFVPLYCPADKDGKYAYDMVMLVRADSPVQKPEDLKGRTVGLVSLSSNSGGRAPLVLLKDKFGLLPGRDYKYAITGGHGRSLKDLAGGRHDAVCVASDLLAAEVKAGTVREDQLRRVATEGPFPPLCFGVPHNLPPDLRKQVEGVFEGFRVGEPGGGEGKFARVDYALNWKTVRDVDASLSRMLDAK